jgi:hypothetical protein
MHSHAFVSIPRTGTNSFRKSLGLTSKEFNHQSAAQIKAKLGDDEWDRRFTFTFVRNPYSRLVSWFSYCRQPSHIQPWARHLYVGKTFAEWVMEGCPHHFRRLFGLNPFYLTEYLWDSNGSVLVDFVGRVENYAADFDYVCKQLGVPTPPLQHVNKSKHENYRKYYKDPLVRKLADGMFAEDCEAFDYTF